MSADDKQIKVAAEKEEFDRQNAFELGFAKVAQDMGLSDDEFGAFYSLAVQRLSSDQ